MVRPARDGVSNLAPKQFHLSNHFNSYDVVGFDEGRRPILVAGQTVFLLRWLGKIYTQKIV